MMIPRQFRIPAFALAFLVSLFLSAPGASASRLAESLPPLEEDTFVFYVWSDTHFDGRDHVGLRDDAVDDMNRLAEEHLPAGYGLCDPVAFVLHAGDITANAREEMWQNDDGHTDNDFLSCISRLNWPVFEVSGNHDADGGRPYILQGIAERHGEQSYSFEYGGVHFIGLGLTRGAPRPDSEELAWLEEEMKGIDKSTPIILWQHFNFNDDAAWDPFYQAISEHNIALLIHGHTHRHNRYRWRGMDVWDAGHNDGRVNAWSTIPSTISVMKVENGRLFASHYITTEDRWDTTFMLDKPLHEDE